MRCFALFLAAGCASTPTAVDYAGRTVVVRAAGGERAMTYRFGVVPSTWRSLSVEGNDAAWHDPDTDGTIHVDHSCERTQDVPLQALVMHLLAGFTQRSFELEETIPFDQREARHVVVLARFDGRPVRMELFVMKKDGCVFDLGYMAVADRFGAGRAAFTEFVRGFHTIDTGSPADVRGASR